ncbi:winged helix-turn-helix transcriptional regulator [Sphingomonas sp. KC8]|uniref:winged helix-turn-helix transcriptional regulator n=1 Tax=Sphingomonas sp. KC8 TaxID=1030157 RepID=UPI0002489C12|nr:helix-turn-helix domain-containing protein [Sphingomonas sp. KC8]ARS28607.1 transcriptional regulator [Sphingomonas sp. KC8]
MAPIEHLKRTVIQCSLPAALEAMGERWSFMILRATFNGLSHFEQFQTTLGIARNILANRLTRLVDHGILERRACDDDRRKVEYRLTPKGEALLPTLIALRQWGEKWEAGTPNNPVLVDAQEGKPVADILVRAQDGRPLGLHDLRWVDRADIERAEARCIYTGEPIGAK